MMTESTGFTPPTPAPVTPEQFAQQVAAQVAAQPVPATVADAMTQRGPLLPAEEKMDALMEALKTQSDLLAKQQSQLDAMQAQVTAAQAATGPPPVVHYAQAAVEYADMLVRTYPSLGTAHFRPLLDAAEVMQRAAEALVSGSGTAADVQAAAGEIERFAARTHHRLGGPHIDWSTLLDYVDITVTEALKLAPAAG